MDSVNLLETLTTVIFCGFLILFIIPQALIRLFYIQPQILRFSVKGKIQLRGIWQPVVNSLLRILVVAALYFAAFIIDRETAQTVLYSQAALFCWIFGFAAMLIRAVLSHKSIQRSFYEDYYLKYATVETQKRFQEFLQFVDTLYLNEAQDYLMKKGLNYLEKKALEAHIEALKGQQKLDEPAFATPSAATAK